MKSCDECKYGKRFYADGYIMKNWSMKYTGDIGALPKAPNPDHFWTYIECAKNAKKLQHINVDGKCAGYSALTNK